MFSWAYRSPQPKRHFDRFSHFCITHGRVSFGMPGHVLFPKNCPFTWGDLDSHLIRVSLGSPRSTSQTESRSIQPFCTAHGRASYTLERAVPSPVKKCSCSWGDLDSHLIHGSLGLPDPTTQTAFRSVQLFLQGSLVWQTDRQTDRQTTLLGL